MVLSNERLAALLRGEAPQNDMELGVRILIQMNILSLESQTGDDDGWDAPPLLKSRGAKLP